MSEDSNDDYTDLVEDLTDVYDEDLGEDLTDAYNDDLAEELNDELKPCPFCGSRAYIDYCNYDHGYAVICSNCCIDTGRFIDKEACIKVWNNRPIENKKDNKIKELMDDLAFSKKWMKEIENLVPFDVYLDILTEKPADSLVKQIKGGRR